MENKTPPKEAKKPDKEDILRLKKSILFVPCKTKEDLHRWVKVFINIDLPSTNVCEESTSNPMNLLWEMYSKALDGKDPNFTHVLGFSARGAMKTLCASIFELLCIFTLRRNVVHFAALESQALVATDYINDYLRMEVLKDFIISKNKRTIQVRWYENDSRSIRLSPEEYKTRLNKSDFNEKTYSVEIVVASMKSVNGKHAEVVVADEIDLTPRKILNEAAGITDKGQDGELPLTFYTSTRKFATGNVQDLIDNSATNGINIRFWSILDVTEKCPTTRHLPDLPKIPIYFNEKNLIAMSEEDYLQLSPDKQVEFSVKEGYQGCLSKCKMFSFCRGRLIDQQSTSKMLKSVDFLQMKAQTTEADIFKSQYLCLKPSSEGLVYPRLDRDLHCLAPNEIAEKLTGEEHPKSMNKQQLIALLKTVHGSFICGMDWGYTHCWAGCVAFVDGNRAFVIEAWEVPGLELSQKLELAESVLRPYNCSAIWADPAYPSDIKTFKRAGYKMKDWNKNAGSVVAGIEIVRMKLMPGFDEEPQLYFLRDDSGCELLVQRMARYRWKIDSQERPTAVPDDDFDDLCDSNRYLIMNTFSPKGRLSMSIDKTAPSKFLTGEPQYSSQDWMKQIIKERLGEISDDQDLPPEDPNQKKKGFLFKI